jgi:hypothetical protein
MASAHHCVPLRFPLIVCATGQILIHTCFNMAPRLRASGSRLDSVFHKRSTKT